MPKKINISALKTNKTAFLKKAGIIAAAVVGVTLAGALAFAAFQPSEEEAVESAE